MARQRRRSGSRPYQRTTRVNELVREIIAEELQTIGDERLELVSITGVEVDAELRTGVVFFDTVAGDEGNDTEVVGVFGEYRVRLQRAIGDQARMRRTPELSFRPDVGVRAGLRVEEILRSLDEPAIHETSGGDDAPAGDSREADHDQ